MYAALVLPYFVGIKLGRCQCQKCVLVGAHQLADYMHELRKAWIGTGHVNDERTSTWVIT